MRNLDRRSLFRGASGLAAAAALLSSPAAEAVTTPAAAPHDALTEVRRRIAEVIAADSEVGAAETANDTARAEAAEKRHGALYAELREFGDELNGEVPKSWLDVVARAELAAFPILWDRPRMSWQGMQRMLDREYDDEVRSSAALALAILYIAERDGGQGNG